MSTTIQEDVCSHVKVVVRVRPESQKERDGNFVKVLQVVDKHILVFDPKVEEVSFFHGKKQPYRDLNKRQNKDLKFMFDAVFGEDSSQLEVFKETTKTVLDGFLNGYNCTVLAYGATGAGKTHTMLGSPENPGVMYLTMMELYNSIEQMKEEKHCAIAVSYLEVYNEQIHDLLVNSGALAVREDPQKGVVVQGLTLHQPKSAAEILQMLDYGNKNRTQHPTDVNASSSRSHAVFQIYLRQQDKTASINQNVRIAKMCLIDLAGSERASATKAKGARFREGANINRSLLALGNVINALADPKSKKQHIPYRNSKLTRLLKDSLGGNCRTIIIAAVSPSSLFYDDTYNTLKYASRAKDIKSSLKSNVVSLDSHISQYVKICEEQKKEIETLKEKLRAYELSKVCAPINHETDKFTTQQQVEISRMAIYMFNIKSILLKELCKDLQCYHLKLEVKDLKRQINYMRTLASLQEQQYRQTEKMLSAALPVLRKQYVNLKNAGLANGVTEDDFREFEQLIHREKAVVWADQMGEEEPKQNDQPMMSAVMAFPELVSYQNTPCRTPSDISSDKIKLRVQHKIEDGVPPNKRTRRKLMESPLTEQTPNRSSQLSPNHLGDSISKALHPIVYTPEACRNPVKNLYTKTVVKSALHITSLQETNSCTEQGQEPLKQDSPRDITHHKTSESHLNTTVTLYESNDNSTDYPSDVSRNNSQPSNSSSVLQRLGLPSLLNRQPGPIHEKPSYMAMTSAAERKRKMLSSSLSIGLKHHQGPTAAKRIRQDVMLSNKPLRVPKDTGIRTRSWKQHNALRRPVKSNFKENVAVDIKPGASKTAF
ncbi:kinesin-like protein KIF18A [Sceloporus undulatus]|uniref:kinesin-like protein KIF18A n=1 Tax=Sceloporus undulatus TaxID=8520 RepID=UPI001C4BF7F3|nr:kinesin-like protein KIF18A [Sceloporus undulatus]